MPSSPRLSLEHTAAGLVVAGELDGHSAPELERALAGFDATREIRVDVRAVGFVDSTGLRTLLAAHQRCADAGGRLILVGPSNAMQRLLDLTGLRSRFALEG